MDEIEGEVDGILERMKRLADRIRTSPNYTVEIGRQLGLETTDEGCESTAWEGPAGPPDYVFADWKQPESR